MMKICPVCRQQFPSKAALAQHMPSHQRQRGGGRPRVQRQAANRGGEGTSVLAKRELVASTSRGAYYTLLPGSSGITYLDTWASIFENYRFTKLSVRVIGLASSTDPKCYHIGISYGANAPGTDARTVASLSPGTAMRGDGSATINVPIASFMKSAWQLTAAGGGLTPGYIVIDTVGKVEVWIDYQVQFSGPIAKPTARRTLLNKEAGDKKYHWFDESNRLIDSYTLDEYTTVEFEGQTAATDWKAWITAFKDAMRLSGLITDIFNATIGMASWLVAPATYALPAINGPAILSFSPRPFRAALLRLNSILAEEDSFVGGGVVDRADKNLDAGSSTVFHKGAITDVTYIGGTVEEGGRTASFSPQYAKDRIAELQGFLDLYTTETGESTDGAGGSGQHLQRSPK